MSEIYVRIDEENGTGTITEASRKVNYDPLTAFAIWLISVGSAVGVAWFFVWAAIGGWRLVHHWCDVIAAAF